MGCSIPIITMPTPIPSSSRFPPPPRPPRFTLWRARSVSGVCRPTQRASAGHCPRAALTRRGCLVCLFDGPRVSARLYLGNGTEYLLDVPEPGTFGLLCLGFLGIAGFMRKRLKIARATAMIAGIAIVASIPGWTQAVDLADGPAGNATYLNTMMHGPAQFARITPLSTGLPFYAANYQSLGTKMLRYKIVGTDPSLGAATTTIPTVIVPLKFVFPQVGSPTLDGTNVVPAVRELADIPDRGLHRRWDRSGNHAIWGCDAARRVLEPARFFAGRLSRTPRHANDCPDCDHQFDLRPGSSLSD